MKKPPSRIKKMWDKLSLEFKITSIIAVISSIVLPIIFNRYSKETLTENDKKSIQIQDSIQGINLSIGPVLLEKQHKYALFYGSSFPNDTVMFYSTIPLLVESEYHKRLDSIEVGFIFPNDAKIHIKEYEFDDVPNRVDRFFNISTRQVTVKYIVRNVNKNYVHLIEEPLYQPLSTMKVHFLEGQNKHDINLKSLKEFEFIDFNDIDSTGVGEIIWDFKIYCSSEFGTDTYNLAIGRYIVNDKKELVEKAETYLFGLDSLNQRKTSALILYDSNDSMGSTSILRDSVNINVTIVNEKIELEKIGEIYIDHANKEIIRYNIED